MKGFAIPFLGVIFVTLISSSIQSIYADHLEPDQGIFSSEDEIEYVTTEDSNYKIYGYMLNKIKNLKYKDIKPSSKYDGKLALKNYSRLLLENADNLESIYLAKIK